MPLGLSYRHAKDSLNIETGARWPYRCGFEQLPRPELQRERGK